MGFVSVRLATDTEEMEETTTMSDHLQMSYRRQYVLLSYFKTLSVGPIWGLNSRPPAQQFGAPQHELTKRGLKYIGLLLQD